MTATSPARASMAREELSQRVLARLLEKHDPAKSRHKPLSLLRPELRRLAEQLIEQEAGTVGLDLRDGVLDDVMLEIPGIGPLEELFRDEAVSEFMVLSPEQVIRRGAGGWVPTGVQFRDIEQVRQTIKKLFATSTPIGDVPTTSDGAADAILANGFRMLAVLPPRALELTPTAVFRRPLAAVPVHTPAPSGTVTLMPKPVALSGAASSSQSVRMIDPWEKIRQRVTDSFAKKLAASGIYDISGIPPAELRKVIAQYVVEFNDADKLHLDPAAREQLTNDILVGMQH